jgi:hypothetical protein
MMLATAMKAPPKIVRRCVAVLITASALMLLGACGSNNPNSATPGTEQSQPLTWGSGSWDNTDWT